MKIYLVYFEHNKHHLHTFYPYFHEYECNGIYAAYLALLRYFKYQMLQQMLEQLLEHILKHFHSLRLEKILRHANWTLPKFGKLEFLSIWEWKSEHFFVEDQMFLIKVNNCVFSLIVTEKKIN